jgi:pimeloyl-ACP methyl ester carboxylesterase
VSYGACVKRSGFSATVKGGALEGWTSGEGPEVLLLHGGPGLSYEYLDGLAGEIGSGFLIAAFQQRGLAPSTVEGPFDLDTAVADAVAVLDALQWDRAWVVGHSWGGYLLLHLLSTASGRLHGGLAVDPLGGTGDGGGAAFNVEMDARTPENDRRRAQELDERAMRGEGTPEEALESMRLCWPAYFASPERVMPFPSVRFSVAAYAGLIDAAQNAIPRLERALAGVDTPFGCVAGARSPLPTELAAAPTARSIPGAWLEVIEDAGHFPWFEHPGCVRAALKRLVETAPA